MKRSGDRVIARDRVIERINPTDFSVSPCLRGEALVQITRSPDHPITRFSKRLLYAAHIVFAALREIFDEGAYDRFLLRTRASRSIASYRDFLREREAIVARRPRCC